MHLCKLEDIPIGSARGFNVNGRDILVARPHAQVVAAYLNRCPHLGVPLNWYPDAFMDSESAFLRCSTHGALFEPGTGLCVLGPCRGDKLWQLECEIREDGIHLDEGGLPPHQTST
jgi:nitrite reductase/ring-hydroxylating ferredoxin subunit